MREIEKICSIYNKNSNFIVDNIDFNFPAEAEVYDDLTRRKTDPNSNESVGDDTIVIQRLNTYSGLKQREIIPLGQIPAWIKGKNFGALARYYLSLVTIRLDGATRTSLLNPAQRSDFLGPPTNVLSALWLDPSAREKIRLLTYEAFGVYFVLDALHGSQIRARLAKRAPLDESEEQSLDLRAREYHKNSIELVDASDGVKAFTGMVATILGQNCKILLIDEPEAFLHPPLARRLGKELAETTTGRDASAFIATHSADFLMGCVAGSSEVNIVRLTYKDGVPTAKLLKHERLKDIMKSPLMRSTGVLSALFHEGAIICEGDSDRALYQEINYRIASVEKKGFSEAIFINAHSKQSTSKVAGPLREMGIPAAIIVDFDVLKEGVELRDILNDINVPEAISRGWCQQKSIISKYCTEQGIDWHKRGMLDITSAEMLTSAKVLLRSLADFGVFVVPHGALETWLAYIGVSPTNNKKYWLVQVFEKLGGDPDSDNYCKPTSDDIWGFVRKIAEWINNPDRLGCK